MSLLATTDHRGGDMNTTSSNYGLHSHHQDTKPVTHLAERTFAKVDAAILGIFLVFLGAGGMVYPGYAGLHLNMAHSLMLIVTGAISFYAGVMATLHAER